MKKNLRASLLLISISILLYSCSFAPVNNQYEKAGTLKKGNLELSGSYTGYGASAEGESGSSNNNIGFRAGYGISDKFDLKIRYEKIMPSSHFDSEDFAGSSNINYFSLVPKIALVPEKFSLLVPVSVYSVKEEYDGYKNNSSFYSIAPQVIYTFTNKKQKVDFSLGAKGDIWFGGAGGTIIFETTAGAGFSSDLRKWAIRPELGLSLVGGGLFYSYGVGLQFVIPTGKK